MSSRPLLYLGNIACLWLLFFCEARAQYGALLPYVPEQANVLVMINVAQILRSHEASIKDWKNRLAFAFAEGATRLPADASQIVMAAEMDFAHRETAWEISVMQTEEMWSDDKLVRAAGGYLDGLEKRPAAWSPLDSYMIRLAPHCMGTYSPADRQRASHWANRQRKGLMAPFLEQMVQRSDTKTASATIALDLQDVSDVEQLVRHLDKCKTTKANGVSSPRLAAALATIKGAVLWVTFSTPTIARLQFEFEADMSATQGYAKPLLLELLASYGAQIDDLADWRITMVPRAVRLDGNMSETMVRRVFSFLRTQPPVDDQTVTDSKLSQAEATLRQFKTIVMFLDDLKLQWKREGDMPAISLWAGNYAQRIEELPADNLPGRFVAYRVEVARLLRRVGDAAKYGEGSIWAGRFAPWKDCEKINSETVKIRKEMTDQFNIPF